MKDSIEQAIDQLVEAEGVPQRHARYGWIIDWADPDIFSDRMDLEKGRIGPRDISPELLADLKAGKGEEFEMYDDDNNLYYKGRIVGDYDGFEPKDDFGGPNAGVTGIKLSGKWV